MRIGQRFFGLAQLASQPRCFIYFISFFHANYFTISATAILPNPPHHGVRALNVVFTLHGTSTPLACFHLSYQLHFETFAVTNHVHDTSVLSFQSTNLFQDRTGFAICHLPFAICGVRRIRYRRPGPCRFTFHVSRFTHHGPRLTELVFCHLPSLPGG